MKILPPVTQPPKTPRHRLHRPLATAARLGYRKFKPCLRWDFGFTCAFCLLHESDLSNAGTAGTRLMWIEHFIPQSRGSARRNDYRNCFYCCEPCNSARGTRPVRSRHGHVLLNPCRVAWGGHFDAVDDELRPRDPDAQYTQEAYDLNDRRKVRMRRIRRRKIGESLRFLAQAPALIRRLTLCAQKRSDPEVQALLLESARLHSARIESTIKDLRLFPVLPEDRDAGCACRGPVPLRLPADIERQSITVRLPPLAH